MNVKKSPWSKVNRVFWWIAAVAIGTMAITTTADVLYRWVMGGAIGPVYSLCETLMAVMVWSALAPTQEENGHIGVTIFTSRLKGKTKAVFEIIALLICIIFFALIFWKTLEDGIWAYGVKTFRYGDYYRFPTWWARLYVPVGTLAMIGQLVFETINNFKVVFSGSKNDEAGVLNAGKKEV